MSDHKKAAGHLAAFITILFWGTTFISTKVLLRQFLPVEILFIRFVIGYLALWAACPKQLRPKEKKQEWLFAAAGLCGVSLYYLLENIALTYTLASNVGVIVSIAPFFAALFNCLLLHGERPDRRFLIGFLIAMAGICLLSFGGAGNVSVNPTGDFLAACAAILWALYSTLTKKISGLGINTILTTRRVFFYGLIFMIPVLSIFGFDVSAAEMAEPLNLFNLLFLGLGASALCFVTWGYAVRHLGSVGTCVYIYMVPVITTAASALILGEVITGTAVVGIVLTLTGLFLSESKNLFGNKGGEKNGFTKRKVCDGNR